LRNLKKTNEFDIVRKITEEKVLDSQTYQLNDSGVTEYKDFTYRQILQESLLLQTSISVRTLVPSP